MLILREAVFTTLSFLVILMAACSPGGAGTATLQPATPQVTQAPGAPDDSNPAAQRARAFLAMELGIPLEMVTLASAEAMDWSDSCLGLGGPAESCALVIVSGWRFMLEAGGQVYEVRSDESGQALRLAPGAVSPTDPAAGAGGTELEGSAWTLVSMGPPDGQVDVPAGSPVTLEFQPGGRAGGSGGCNTYGGGYEAGEGQISFSQMVVTAMACVDTQVMDQEQRFLAALQAAESFELDGERLVIGYNAGAGVLTFTRSA